MSSLVFREWGGFDSIPGIDHVGLFANNKIYESLQSYKEGDYYDPLTGGKVHVKNFYGVQNYHTLGSWSHISSTDIKNPEILELREVKILDALAQALAGIISNKVEKAGYQPFLPYLYNLSPFAQKGGWAEDKFTCVGLIEWAAEKAGHNFGNGFIPNCAEWINLFDGAQLPVLLTPELLYRYASNQTVKDIIKNQAEEFAAWGASYATQVANDAVQGATNYLEGAVKGVLNKFNPLRPRYLNGFLDPVDFILTDPLGRRLGHTAALGTINEIPDAIYTGDGVVENFAILNPLPGSYHIQLIGLGENALAAIGDELGGFIFNQFLGSGQTNSAVFTLLNESQSGHKLQGGIGNETLGGSIGNDLLNGASGNDYLNSGSGNDEVYGGSGADELDGGTDNDFLQGGRGNDLIKGDSGSDTVDHSTSNSGVVVNIDESISYEHQQQPGYFDLESNFGIESGAAQDGFGSKDILRNLENIIGSPYNDILIGNAADNIIQGVAGNDILINSSGNDKLDGDEGVDIVSYRRDPNGVYVSLKDGNANDGFGNQDGISGVENVVGSAFNDEIHGDDGINTITGGDGSDIVYAWGGNDYLFGESGNDFLNGDAGSDVLFGQLDNDILNGGDDSDLLYGQQGADVLSGDAGNDLLYGGIDNDSLYGGGDADSLYGQIGDDQLFGNAGTDTLYGGDGADILSGGKDVVKITIYFKAKMATTP